MDEKGDFRKAEITGERPLTIYVDKHEIVTLMTLGSEPELLTIGYLFNQKFIQDLSEVRSVHVDWEVEASVVKTLNGIKGLEQKFPSLMQVHLEDYKVRVLTSGDGTAAKVRVLIESSDGRDVWGTVGVSENVIEASWIALADSLHYKLLKDALEAAGEGQTATG